MSKILVGHIDYPVWKRFTCDRAAPAIQVDWGFYFDGVVGGEYAEMFVCIYSEDFNTMLGNGYIFHNSGPAGIFHKTVQIYHGTPELNSGDNFSNYNGVPFAAGQRVIVYFRAAKEIWNGYKFGVNWAQVSMYGNV